MSGGQGDVWREVSRKNVLHGTQSSTQTYRRTIQNARLRGRIKPYVRDLTAKLPPELLGKYQKVVERRRPGVAVVSTELCSGCRVGIPPQAFVNLISGETIQVCGSCRRILIHKSMLAGDA